MKPQAHLLCSPTLPQVENLRERQQATARKKRAPPLDVRRGHLYLPDRPGLGINLLPEVLAEYEARPEDSAPEYA